MATQSDPQQLTIPARQVQRGDVLVLGGTPAAEPVDHIDDRGPALVLGFGNHAIIRAGRVQVTVLRPAADGRRAVIARLTAAVLEHEEAWAAWVRPDVDPAEREATGRRLAEARLALADRYSEASVHYRPGTPTRVAMVHAASYIRAAAVGSPALVDARAGGA